MISSRLIRAALVATLLAASGCGQSPSRSTTGPSPGPAPGAPVAAFSLTVDALQSQEAVRGVSDVAFDASPSTGGRLQYRFDFGDGASATDAVAHHVYATEGTFTIALTVTDERGRTATTSRQLVVATPVGRWAFSGFVARAGRVDVQTLTLTAQDGGSISGVLSRVTRRDVALAGTVTADRQVRLAAADQSEVLEGTLPSVLSGAAANWPLTARGGTADGETLAFVRRDADPAGPPPDAVLKMRFFSFQAPFAVKQISPVQFDASTSRGDGLAYFIEFGDGQLTSEPLAVHPTPDGGESFHLPRSYTARLTVVDRFGRADYEERTFEVRTLVTKGNYVEWNGVNPDLGKGLIIVKIDSQDATHVTGRIARSGPLTAFDGTIDADGNVSWHVSGSNTSLVGTLSLPKLENSLSNHFELTYVGGPYDGETLTLYFRDGY
jgi:PKD repeat protein